jgi:hypothetical protein
MMFLCFAWCCSEEKGTGRKGGGAGGAQLSGSCSTCCTHNIVAENSIAGMTLDHFASTRF